MHTGYFINLDPVRYDFIFFALFPFLSSLDGIVGRLFINHSWLTLAFLAILAPPFSSVPPDPFYFAALPFNALLFRQSARPRLLYSLPSICLFSPFASFQVSLTVPLYAGRSSKRRIIVGPRPILLFRGEQCGLSLSPSRPPTSPAASDHRLNITT